MPDNNHLFQTRQYNALADCIRDVLLNTKAEHLEVACSICLRIVRALAMKSSNMQIGRMMDAAGIPRSTSHTHTRRD
jgi:hypothetical protein